MSDDDARSTMLDHLRRGPAPLQALAASLAARFGARPDGWGPTAADHLDALQVAGAVLGPDRTWCYRLA